MTNFFIITAYRKYNMINNKKSCARHIFRDLKMKKLYTIALCVMGLMLVSCNSKTDKNVPTYFPFKAKDTDKWGFVDNNGKVVYENLFDNLPTCVFNDMFFVQMDDGYELYSIKNPTVKLGGPYLTVANFTGDLAPCAIECENIKYIDKKGKVVFELPNNAVRAFEFENGYSSFILKSGDNYINKIVDTKGNILEFKDYNLAKALNDGTFLASKDDSKYVILDKNGTELYQLEGLRYSADCLSSDLKHYICCTDGALGRGNLGVRNVDGKNLFENKYNRVEFADDGNVILEIGDSFFSAGGKECFVMNLNGETIFHDYYDGIANCRNGIVLAIKDGKFGAVDYSGKTIIEFDNNVLTFVPGTHLIVGSKDNNSPIRLFDEQGLTISEYDRFDFVNIISNSAPVLSMSPSLNEKLWYTFPQNAGAETDCFDAVGLLKSFMHPDGKSFSNLLGYKGMTPSECVKQMAKSYSALDIEEENKCLPFEKLTSNDFGIIMISLGFDEVVHTEYDWYGDVHYGYSNAPCEFMILSQSLRNESQFHSNHIKKIDNVIVSVLEEEGYSEKYDRNQDLVFYENGNVQLVYQLNSNELRMFVQVSSVQNSASLSPEYHQQSNSGVNMFVVIDGSQLRLRLGPSTSSDTFKWPDGTNRHPNVGDRFRYLGESGDFYKIDFNGLELWVSKHYSHLE